jgi:hypothetical protein
LIEFILKPSTSLLNHFVGCGMCVVVLSWPVAGATKPAMPVGATELAADSATTAPVAKWNESNIRESFRVFTASPSALTVACAQSAISQRKVAVTADAAGVRIVEVGAPARLLALREGLLPEVHYLRDGRHALMATRSGWVMKIDLEQVRLVAEIRAGLMARGVALSASHAGWPSLLAVGNGEPHTLAVLDENLKLVKLLSVAGKVGTKSSGIAAIRTSAVRNSFVASLMDVPELWEISYDPKAPEIALGMVHDFQYREGQFVPGYLNPQRTVLPSPTEDFFLTGAGNNVLTAHSDVDFSRPGASARVLVTNLDVRRKITEFALPGWPALAGSVAWRAEGKDRLAVPNARLGLVSVLDPARWTVLGHLRTDGPVRGLRSTPGSRWLLLDSGGTAGAPAILLRVDKSTLEVQEGVVEAGDNELASSPFAAGAECTP